MPFESLTDSLRRRAGSAGDERQQTAFRNQLHAIEQIDGMRGTLADQRQQAGDALLSQGQEQISADFRDAGGQMRSALAGRRLLGSSGHARGVGQQASAQHGASEAQAQDVRDWLAAQEGQDLSMLQNQASTAMGILDPDSIGGDASQYQHLINRMGQDISADRRTANSMFIGDLMRQPIGGLVNYGFDRADHMNHQAHMGRMRAAHGDPGGQMPQGRVFAPFG